MNCPLKVKLFIWQILHQSLPTSSFLFSKHIIPSPFCSLCGEYDDSNHWIIQCKAFSEVRKAIHWITWDNIDFLSLICQSNQSIEHEISKIACLLWHIWLARNATIFRNAPISTLGIIKATESMIHNHDLTQTASYTRPTCDIYQHYVQWKLSTVTNLKMNTYGGVSKTKNLAGVGVIICNQQGQHIVNWVNCTLPFSTMTILTLYPLNYQSQQLMLQTINFVVIDHFSLTGLNLLTVETPPAHHVRFNEGIIVILHLAPLFSFIPLKRRATHFI